MRRFIVLLVATLLVLHGALPHHSADRSGVSASVVDTGDRPAPAQFVPIADTGHVGLPHRAAHLRSASQPSPLVPLRWTTADPARHGRSTARDITDTPTPDRSGLQVYRC